MNTSYDQHYRFTYINLTTLHIKTSTVTNFSCIYRWGHKGKKPRSDQIKKRIRASLRDCLVTVSSWTRRTWSAMPPAVESFLWQTWHSKCLAYWSWRRIVSSSNSGHSSRTTTSMPASSSSRRRPTRSRRPLSSPLAFFDPELPALDFGDRPIRESKRNQMVGW